MRASQAVSIRPVLRQAIASINAFFALEKQSQKIAAEFYFEHERLLEMPESTAPATKLETLTRNQLRQDVTAMLGPAPRNNPAKENEEGIESNPGINYEKAIKNYRVRKEALLRPHITRPKIENFYPWRYSAELAAKSLGNEVWATEAGAILDALHELPKQSVPIAWEEPGAIDELRDSVRTVANRVLEILIAANRELEILIACIESEESVGDGRVDQAAMKDLIESGALGKKATEILNKSDELRGLEDKWGKHQLQGGTKETFGVRNYLRMYYLKNLRKKT